MTWSKGQPWRTVRSLDRLNAQVRAAYPRAVPPATPASSWGSIADSAHSSTSDHYPHFYRALGATAVVCARDFPHAPALGLDAHALAEQLRLSRDPRVAYIISNGRITGPGHGWRWDPYSGSDPHGTHIHVSTVHTAAADDPRDWQIGDDDMPITDADADKIAARSASKTWSAPYGPTEDTADVLSDARTQARAGRLAAEATLAAVKGLDTVAVLARINEVAAQEQQRDAELRAMVERVQSGGMSADEFVNALAARLAG